MYVSMSYAWCLQRPEYGIKSPEARVIEDTVWVLGTEFGSSTSLARALNC